MRNGVKLREFQENMPGGKTAAIVLFNAKEIWNEIAAIFVASLFFRGREILTNLVLRMVVKRGTRRDDDGRAGWSRAKQKCGLVTHAR